MTKSPLEAAPPDTTTFGGKDFNIMGFPGGSDSNKFTCRQETWIQSLGREDPLEKGIWQPASSILP